MFNMVIIIKEYYTKWMQLFKFGNINAILHKNNIAYFKLLNILCLYRKAHFNKNLIVNQNQE